MMIAGRTAAITGKACEAMKADIGKQRNVQSGLCLYTRLWWNIATFKPDFHQYDLIVINYGGATWTEPVRKNFEKYVADGGGVVVIHSSVVPMADWKEYNEIIGMGHGTDETKRTVRICTGKTDNTSTTTLRGMPATTACSTKPS